jgi:Asp-tRNA(Asn)/Glu-tRNA(Gln) amidotransferase A subunit family amidase
MGLQLEAAWWEEPTLLRAGVAYQSATDWHLAKPQLS